MSEKKKFATYVYGIKRFSYCVNKETNKFEEDKLIMVYGHDKFFIFPKKLTYELIRAIYGDKQLKSMAFSKEVFDFEVEKFGLLNLLNGRCSGKGFVMITGFENGVEYINGCQNDFIGITGLDLQGKFLAHEKRGMFTKGIASYDTSEYREAMEEELEEKINYDA